MPSWTSLIVTFLPAIVASFAFTTSMLYSFWCESIQFAVQESSDSDIFIDLHFGPFYQKTTSYRQVDGTPYMVQESSCGEWSTYGGDKDGSWKLTRAMAVLAPLLGGLLAIILWFRPCWAGRISPRNWRLVALLYACLITPLQALTFLLFQSNACTENPVVASIETQFARDDLYETQCAWDQGSTANVFSVVLWLATAVIMLVVGAPQTPVPSPPEMQTVTYERDAAGVVHEVNVVKGTAVAPEQKV